MNDWIVPGQNAPGQRGISTAEIATYPVELHFCGAVFLKPLSQATSGFFWLDKMTAS